MTDKKTDKKGGTRFSSVVKRRQSVPDAEPEIAEAPVATTAAPAAPASAPKIRQPGKKDNPDYVQVTVYLRKDIYKTARKLLIDDGRQVSELVDDLVSRWISDRHKV
jgi:hypothetical protein